MGLAFIIKFLMVVISDAVEGAAAAAVEHWLKVKTWTKKKGK